MAKGHEGAASCCFCREFDAGEMPGDFVVNMGQRNRVFMSDEHFVAMPTVSPLSVGHTLIVPMVHLTSLAQLDRQRRISLATFSKRVVAKVRDRYGSFLLFEHGVGAGKTGGCGVTHAHLHVLPLSKAHAEQVKQRICSDHPDQTCGSFSNVLASVHQDATYLIYGDSFSHVQVIVQADIPSQYLRKLLAETLGRHEWDWKRLEGWDEMVATYDSLRESIPIVS